MNNCWNILGIEETRDIEKIKHTYHRLVKKYHPDKAKNPQEAESFTKICSDLNFAYESAIQYAKTAEKMQDVDSTPKPENFSDDSTFNDFTDQNTKKTNDDISIKTPTFISEILNGFSEDIKSLFTVFSGLIIFFYTLKKQYPIALLFVLIITAYGAWCFMDYISLRSAGIIGPSYMNRGIAPYYVSLAGIWLGWSGLRNLVNACQDWDQSLGYLKIIGGTALIAITHFFLYVMRTV